MSGFELELLDAAAEFHEVVRIGRGCRFAPGVRLGDVGFGYEWTDDGWQLRDHDYGVVIGDSVEIGANTVVHRGRWRDTKIGDRTKIDSLVFVAHNVQIGQDCLIVANTMIAGSVTIGERVIVGGGAQLKQGVTVGDDAMIGLGAVVLADVPPGAVMVGNPARHLRQRRPGEGL